MKLAVLSSPLPEHGAQADVPCLQEAVTFAGFNEHIPAALLRHFDVLHECRNPDWNVNQSFILKSRAAGEGVS